MMRRNKLTSTISVVLVTVMLLSACSMESLSTSASSRITKTTTAKETEKETKIVTEETEKVTEKIKTKTEMTTQETMVEVVVKKQEDPIIQFELNDLQYSVPSSFQFSEEKSTEINKFYYPDNLRNCMIYVAKGDPVLTDEDMSRMTETVFQVYGDTIDKSFYEGGKKSKSSSQETKDFWIWDSEGETTINNIDCYIYVRMLLDKKTAINYLLSFTVAKSIESQKREEYLASWIITKASLIRKIDNTTNESTTIAPEEETYDNNKYFEVVEKAKYQKYGITYIIHKVIAKQDVTISSTVIAYDKNGDVVGKSSDEICLSKGEMNYFQYTFEEDVKEDDMQISAKPKEDSWLSGGKRNAVKMVKYNKKGNKLYITFEQTDEIGSFSKYKLLFYKDGKITGTEDGYFWIYAEELTGIGSIDVAEISIYNQKFDTIEYTYEP